MWWFLPRHISGCGDRFNPPTTKLSVIACQWCQFNVTVVAWIQLIFHLEVQGYLASFDEQLERNLWSDGLGEKQVQRGFSILEKVPLNFRSLGQIFKGILVCWPSYNTFSGISTGGQLAKTNWQGKCEGVLFEFGMELRQTNGTSFLECEERSLYWHASMFTELRILHCPTPCCFKSVPKPVCLTPNLQNFLYHRLYPFFGKIAFREKTWISSTKKGAAMDSSKRTFF